MEKAPARLSVLGWSRGGLPFLLPVVATGFAQKGRLGRCTANWWGSFPQRRLESKPGMAGSAGRPASLYEWPTIHPELVRGLPQGRAKRQMRSSSLRIRRLARQMRCNAFVLSGFRLPCAFGFRIPVIDPAIICM